MAVSCTVWTTDYKAVYLSGSTTRENLMFKKRALYLLSISIIASMSAGCATFDSSGGNAEWADQLITEDVELVVHGLSCPLCASNLDQQLLRIDGVSDMWVDLQTGYVQIEIESGKTVAATDLNGAVRNAGFTLREIRTRNETP